jgi:hypothetical protein
LNLQAESSKVATPASAVIQIPCRTRRVDFIIHSCHCTIASLDPLQPHSTTLLSICRLWLATHRAQPRIWEVFKRLSPAICSRVVDVLTHSAHPLLSRSWCWGRWWGGWRWNHWCRGYCQFPCPVGDLQCDR